MSYTIKKHKLGYSYIFPTPSEKELSDYYEKKYYQNLTASTYQAAYSEEELTVLKIDADLSNYFFTEYSGDKSGDLIDIACGEGFFMKNMQDLGWNVCGTDYSSHGIVKNNPAFKDKVIYGDLNAVLDDLIQKGTTFDFINLGNILEHVVSPIDLLNNCYKLLNQKGLLRIKVPNDFSSLQQLLTSKGKIEPYWVHPPDHLSYFNFENLPKVLSHCNFTIEKMIGDFPIELFLLHPASNYIDNKVGKEAHQARINYALSIWGLGIEKFLEISSGLAQSQLSRCCIVYSSKISCHESE